MRPNKKHDASSSSAAAEVQSKSPLLLTAVLLVLLLASIFWRLFDPAQVLFSNDGPYGGMVAELNRLPSILFGVWANSNWFGNESLSPPLSTSTLLRLITTPLGYSKLLCPVSLFIVGIGACFCFRKLRLAPMACVLGAIAATLNSDFLSTSAWGVATQVIGFGFMYIAVGLISDNSIKHQWIRVILAGFAVGIGVMEAYDIGALFSLFVAAYVVYHALFLADAQAPAALRVGKGVLRTVLVAGFAGFIAIHTLSGLVGTQIKGIAGMAQDEQTRAARWAEASSFSVPKAATLTVFVPGIFGFRDDWYMYESDAPTDDQYWSSNPAHPIGTGFYAGVPVVVIGLWAAFQSLRRKDSSPFSQIQRRAIWFWVATAVISLLFAWGSFAPFYRLFYALPYASTIRNPQKFMHVLNWSLIILFAYGVHGLAIAYCQNYVARTGGVIAQFKAWFAKASGFDRTWVYGSFIAVGIAVLAWFIYSSQSTQLISYLETKPINAMGRVGIPAPGTQGATTDSHAVAAFSIHAVGWFVLLLALTVAIMSLIFSGQFSGSRAKVGATLLGALLIFDLGRVATHWIVYWNLDYKYVKDPVVQFLAEKPYEQRVAMLPGQPQSGQHAMLMNMYGDDWKQHLFLEKNIQCAEVVQEPRVALDKMAFMSALPLTGNPFNFLRFWELSNTRYLLGPRGNLGPQFKILKTFNFVPKRSNPSQTPADFMSELSTNGELAIYEFVDALPRAKLYSKWQINTNDQSTLQTLASPSFNPHQNVLVDQNIPEPDSKNADPGAVEIDPNYKSKRIELHADVKAPAVLLLSERYNDKWQVEVDGKPAPLLKCNFIERGVYLLPGKHDIVMRYVAPIQTLCISFAAIVMGLVLWGYLIFCLRQKKLEP